VDHRDTVWTTNRISQALETSGQEHGQVNIFLKSLTPDQVADKKINLPERIQLFSEPIPLSYEKAKDLYDVYGHLPELYRSLSFLEYGHRTSFPSQKSYKAEHSPPEAPAAVQPAVALEDLPVNEVEGPVTDGEFIFRDDDVLVDAMVTLTENNAEMGGDLGVEVEA